MMHRAIILGLSMGPCWAEDATASGSAKALTSGNGNGNGGSKGDEQRQQKKRKAGDVIYMLKENATEEQIQRLNAALERAGLAKQREGHGLSEVHTQRRPAQNKQFDYEEGLARDLMSCGIPHTP